MKKAIDICSDLINIQTVTPGGNEIIKYVSDFLEKLGFTTKHLVFSSKDGTNVIDNLYAEYSAGVGPNLGFLGHLDTVPPGDGWKTDPFKCVHVDGQLYGRGIADMKGGAGCFLAALQEALKHIKGSLSIFLTCDEEIGSYEGMQALLDWAVHNNKIPDHCLIGEPSSNVNICDRIYIGHRGSINIQAHASGEQAHSAYVSPQTKNSALEKMCEFVVDIKYYKFKHDDLRFPDNIASATIMHNSNVAVNVIPSSADANFNVRFSADYTSADIVEIFKNLAKKYDISITYKLSGDPYICEDEFLLQIASQSVSDVLGYLPEYSAGGGTSDGRFMIKHCPVIEMGMVDATIHKVDEHVKADDCEKLANVYKKFIELYFKN